MEDSYVRDPDGPDNLDPDPVKSKAFVLMVVGIVSLLALMLLMATFMS